MSTIKSSAENLTLNADGANNDIIFQSNGSNVATLDQAGLLTATSFAGSGANLTSLPAQKVNPNLIINGAMQVAQRSTSTVAQANNSNEGFATLDRWSLQFGTNAGGTITTSQDTESPTGFGTSYKLDVTTAATASGNELVYFTQVIESQDLRTSGWEYTSASSDITLSFWVKNSKTGIYCIATINSDSGKMYTAEYTVSSANTWEKKTITIPGHANLVFNNDNGYGLTLYFILDNASGRYGTAGSWQSANLYGTSNQVNFLDSTSNVMYLTGVKLEIGDTATDFVHRSYAEELHLCQRYFQSHYTGIRGAKGNGSAMIGFSLDLPCAMRAAATCTITGTCSTYSNSAVVQSNGTINSMTVSVFNELGTYLNFNLSGSSITDNRGYTIQSSGYIKMDADLQ